MTKEKNDEITELVQKRGLVKGAVTRIKTYFSNSYTDSHNINLLKGRLNKLQKEFEKFSDVQDKIEMLDSSESQITERDTFETSYYELEADIMSTIERRQNNGRVLSPSSNSTASSGSNIRLPNLELPKFSGQYSDWVPFRDTFLALIHDNYSYSNIEKFHYLRSCLVQDALKSIETVAVSDLNYETAWDQLNDRFENKRLIVQEHIVAILDSPALVKNSYTAIRKLLDDIEINLAALQKLNEPTDQWNSLIVTIAARKFDYFTRREWEEILSKDVPTIKQLTEFLSKRCTWLQSLNAAENKKVDNKKPNVSGTNANNKSRTICNAATDNKFRCPYCKKSHLLYHCPDFFKLTVPDRIQHVVALKLCENCLKDNHKTEKCKANPCPLCKQKHNSLIHQPQVQTTCNKTTIDASTLISAYSGLRPKETLLSTALILVRDFLGNWRQCRALLDPGSQANYISKTLCEELRLEKREVNWSICGIEGMQGNARHLTKIHFKSMNTPYNNNIDCLVVQKITENLPINSFELIKIPENIVLADPSFNISGPIDILLGVSVFYKIIGMSKIPANRQHPHFQETSLGWVIGGDIVCGGSQGITTICNVSLNTLNNQLSRFWEIDEYPSRDTCHKAIKLSQEDTDCEQHFQKTFKRNEDGRFVVRIPFKVHVTDSVGKTKDKALQQFLSTEKKLFKNNTYRDSYTNFLKEYEDLKHMEPIGQPDPCKFDRVYLPHHAVTKETSTTTKVRVVFNPSMKSSTGVTLNDTILTGPKIQDELFNIIIRFRTLQFVFTADINKMFRQIVIADEDRKYQTILWRDNPQRTIEAYQLTTLTFGFVCSPFIAVRCLHQLAEDEKVHYPNASQILKRDFYMDDVLTGANSLNEAIQIRDDLVALLAKGCFELRKFSSNDTRLLPAVGDEVDDTHVINFDKDGNTRTLGLLWNCREDNLRYQVNATSLAGNNITKRKILSIIAKIYDPLSLLGPVIVKAKLIIQELWKSKVGWDEAVPIEIQNSWLKIMKNLHVLNNIAIPRKVITTYPFANIQLHGFADASQVAYGCAIYIRTQDLTGNVNIHLLCAKSRVAPLKPITIPRLELLAALVLARLISNLIKILNVQFDDVFYWTDSTIVLAWLATVPHTLQNFVANRVNEIQDLTIVQKWRHVNTNENPADIISRGTYPTELLNNHLWFHGPEWLKHEPNQWPNRLQLKVTELPEQRKAVVTNNITIRIEVDCPFLTKFSNFTKLRRIIATCYRFIENCKNKARDNSPLSIQEMIRASNIIIKLVQSLKFPEELEVLKLNKSLKKSSKLKTLNPFLDKDGIIRVGGRLRNADLEYNQKHPIVLPKHHVTSLIIKLWHEEQLHAGVAATLAAVRQEFWPLDGRNQVRKIIRNCITCFRAKPSNNEPIMGDLPPARLAVTRPFTNCGVDYAGPLTIKEGNVRSKKTSKAYVALFICFSSKAVHLELVSNLTSDNFLNALKRFTSRRGLPTNIYCDNATNFVGAQNELRQLFQSKEFENIVVNNLNFHKINWHFIPARAPHMGGIWEAAIKSTKFHLKRVVGNALITFEEMYTLLVRIEACLNSRPLCPLSNDPNDLSTLTPGHFLIGTPLTALPEADLSEVPVNRLSRWQHIENIRQQFWSRWSKEYLSQLQQRHRWSKTDRNVEIGMLVLLKENTPPLDWRLGRILELHPGKDGVVRVVTVKVGNGTTKRAVRNLCALPVNDN